MLGLNTQMNDCTKITRSFRDKKIPGHFELLEVSSSFLSSSSCNKSSLLNLDSKVEIIVSLILLTQQKKAEKYIFSVVFVVL